MFFVVFIFTIFTIFWTTGNILLWIVVATLGLIILIIYILFAKKWFWNLRIYIFCVIGSFVATYIYQIMNSYDYPDAINDIWTVTAITGPDRYVISINSQDWIARTSKTYHIWDKVQLLAKITNKSEYPNNIYNLTKIDDWSFLLAWKFDYNRRLAMKGYAWDLQIIGSKYISRSEGFYWYIYDIRDNLSNISRKLFAQKNTIWLLLGLLIWDRSMIDKDTSADFINSGLVHILAVSGGNISMLVLFLSLLLFWLPYYLRIWVIWVLVILYGIICGGDSSVVRAVVMATIATIWIFAGRDIDIWRVLWITYIVMLLANPYALAYDLWFSLSFCAIIGLLLFDFREYMTSKRRYPAREWIMPSIGANLWVLPILILASSKINILSIFANFVILPILPVVLLVWIAVIVFWIYIYWLYGIFIYIINNLADWIFSVSWRTSRNGIYIHFDLLRVKYLLVLLCIIWRIYIYDYNKKKETNKINNK